MEQLRQAFTEIQEGTFLKEGTKPTGGGHMMQHGEGNNSGKLAIREWHGCCVAGDYLNVAASQARS
jgi:hypothetical protein